MSAGISFPIQLLAFTLGTCLLLVVAIAFLGKRGASIAHRATMLALAVSAAWYGTTTGLLLNESLDLSETGLVPVLEAARSGTGVGGAVLTLLAILLWVGARQWRTAGILGGALALVLAGLAVREQHSELFAIAALLPPACFAYLIYRYHYFEILIPRRAVFVFTLALISGLYLLVVSVIADFLDSQYDVFGPMARVLLILGAAVAWLPLYGWITGYFSRRTQVYAAFCRQAIENAVRILSVDQRIQFLAEETGKLFDARRVLIHKSSAPEAQGSYRCEPGPEFMEAIAHLLKIAEKGRAELIHVSRTREPGARILLKRIGFNYAVPLRYEDRLTGVLLVDTAPRQFLDENEPVLLSVSRQVSHSIEACRLVEKKVELETALLRQEHLAALGQAAATIAHEVKNPLSSIKTLAQLMREDPEVMAKYERDLGYIVAETDRLNKCVAQLLTFSRPPAEEVADVGVLELLQTTAETLKREAAGKGVRLEYELSPELRELRADRQMLQQVVLNLALNALDVSSPGAAIRLSAEADTGGRVKIDVADEGPGIPLESQDKIFEPFFTTKQKGSGLGLAIVKKNLRHLHGDMHLTSPLQDGHGTLFTVIIPANSVQGRL